MTIEFDRNGVSRRVLLRAGAGLAGAALTPGMILPVFAEDKPAMGSGLRARRATATRSR